MAASAEQSPSEKELFDQVRLLRCAAAVMHVR